MESPSSPAPATPPATGDDCFAMKKWQFKLRKPSPAIHPARRWRVVQSTEPQRRMRDRDAAIMSAAHRLHAHEPSRCSGSLNKTMCTQDVEQTVQNCDWISTLPDDILVKILSLLTVSDAAMTDCLSSRWRHLWKNVDCLILDLYSLRMPESEICDYHQKPCLRKAQVKKFVRKTNGLLRNHYGNKIKEFTVRFPLTSANASELDHWIRFAASASTEKLCLDLYEKNRSSCLDLSRNEPYNFILSPFSDGRGCRLSELTLSNCTVRTTPANLSGFACLHFLELSRVKIADAAVSNIISNCCALKSLILAFCHQLIHLTATCSQLLKLDVDFCDGLISVCIHADKLGVHVQGTQDKY
ncbi:F-box protein At5g03100 isoform X1 [Triticum aestivum]|uniref:F-box protein At5g03100 isoform X1 n=1 Tax=Triticum aestivum TaxID=4565 RepID=UPI001D01E500|nr:F-box protein At5g03100-like isoform X1 [Triticum aestivum]